MRSRRTAPHDHTAVTQPLRSCYTAVTQPVQCLPQPVQTGVCAGRSRPRRSGGGGDAGPDDGGSAGGSDDDVDDDGSDEDAPEEADAVRCCG